MRKWILAALLAILCMTAISAQASQMLNIYIDKDALMAHDPLLADIRVRPEGMARVVRHSLWLWDEAGTQWSMFVEIENTSEEKIVIDDTWLVACKANRDEIATAEYAFQTTDNVLTPGERTVLYAGAAPWMMPTDYHDVTDFEEVIGLSTFAGKIRRAEILRVRMNTRSSESTQNWPKTEVNANVRVDGRKLRFEMKNETKQVLAFHTIGAAVSDQDGRLMDVLKSSYSGDAVVQPGETLSFEKELQPYITNEMMEGAQIEVFAHLMPDTVRQINAK